MEDAVHSRRAVPGMSYRVDNEDGGGGGPEMSVLIPWPGRQKAKLKKERERAAEQAEIVRREGERWAEINRTEKEKLKKQHAENTELIKREYEERIDDVSIRRIKDIKFQKSSFEKFSQLIGRLANKDRLVKMKLRGDSMTPSQVREMRFEVVNIFEQMMPIVCPEMWIEMLGDNFSDTIISLQNGDIGVCKGWEVDLQSQRKFDNPRVYDSLFDYIIHMLQYLVNPRHGTIKDGTPECSFDDITEILVAECKRLDFIRQERDERFNGGEKVFAENVENLVVEVLYHVDPIKVKWGDTTPGGSFLSDLQSRDQEVREDFINYIILTIQNLDDPSGVMERVRDNLTELLDYIKKDDCFRAHIEPKFHVRHI